MFDGQSGYPLGARLRRATVHASCGAVQALERLTAFRLDRGSNAALCGVTSLHRHSVSFLKVDPSVNVSGGLREVGQVAVVE